MLSPLRNRFGIPGAISVIALVFAMLGGAYAANDSGDGASASAKKNNKAGKRGPRGPRGKQGPAGPAGPAGSQGPAGAKGATGATGPEGKQGPEGKEGPQGKEGKQGKEGPLLTELPSGKSLTGSWGVRSSSPETFAQIGAPISFSFPLSSAPTVYWIDKAGTAGILRSGKPVEEAEFGVDIGPLTAEQFEDKCPGSASEPEAEPGFLCAYTSVEENIESEFGALVTGYLNPPTSYGALLAFKVKATATAADARGTWAVTAP